MKNKIKILLAGYVNNINAQDLNCRALAMFIDKDKFKVSAFLVPQQFRDFEIGDEMKNVNLIQLHRPAKFLWYWIYLKGIFNCDVAYLPKGQKWRWCKFLCKIFRKKSFLTVEGIIDKETYDGLLTKYHTKENIKDMYNSCAKTFSITKYMSKVNFENLGIQSDGVLYLGVDIEKFKVDNRKFKKSQDTLDIIFIGTDIKRKKLNEFLDLAKYFPQTRFHVVGGGANEDIYETLGYEPLDNVKIHGKLSHDDLSELLKTVDLHVFPSRSEGFPKVTLETAAAGVPSIVYSDYGADEWIVNGKSGFVVNTFEQIVAIVDDLQRHPEKLIELSKNSVEMATRFDWRRVVKNWEKKITDIYNDLN